MDRDLDRDRSLAEACARIVGERHALVDPGDVAAYTRDWTGRYTGHTSLVVAPRTVEEVAVVVAECAARGTPLVPQGGNTSLVGGSIPSNGEVVLSLRRLREDLAVDADARLVRVSAGTVLEEIHQVADRHGLTYGVDLASRGSATIGGTIATNAGGLRVLRYGDTRAQLVGVQAVLGDGTVISHLPNVTRDNTGYHLPSLLAGSEGTLAVVTAATLRLHPRPSRRSVALVSLASIEDAVAAAATTVRATRGISAVEFMLPRGIDLVTERLSRPVPVARGAAYLLLEVTDGEEPQEYLSRLPMVLDAAVGETARDRQMLWQWRERHTEAIASVGAAIKMDVTLPFASLVSFLHVVPDAIATVAPRSTVWMFGHLGDGNVHVNVTDVDRDLEGHVQDLVYTMAADGGGSISTEHGIGTAKKRWMPLARSAEELVTFRRIKSALDPAGILNPGVLG